MSACFLLETKRHGGSPAAPISFAPVAAPTAGPLLASIVVHSKGQKASEDRDALAAKSSRNRSCWVQETIETGHAPVRSLAEVLGLY